MLRRDFIAAASTLAVAPTAFSQATYPSKGVRLIVPFPPGGITDAMIRMLAEGLRAAWGQTVVIENRAGAGTIIGTDVVAKSEPDGHTIGVIIAAHTANPSLYKKLPYDTFKDLSGVTMLARAPVALYASNDFPANNMKEFLAYAKKNRGHLSYGSVGAGSQAHLAGEAMSMRTDTDLRHVAYKGSAPAQNDLMGGHLKLLLDALPSGVELVRSGKFKLLGIGSQERSALVPNVATFSEVIPGFQAEAIFGLIVPSATPRAVVEKINAGVQQSLGQTQLQEWFRTRGFTLAKLTPKEFDDYLVSDYKRWNEVIVKTGIQLN